MEHTVSLRKNEEFVRLYKRAQYAAHPLAVVYTRKNRLQTNRLGITASKKIGNAVRRNRARRVLREAYRRIETQLPAGWDIVVVARSKTADAKSTELEPVLLDLVARAKRGANPGGRKGPVKR